MTGTARPPCPGGTGPPHVRTRRGSRPPFGRRTGRWPAAQSPRGFRTNPPRTRRQPGAPSQVPTRQTINNILALASFVDFSNQLQDVHDMVHGWVGGDMGTIAASAFDPIFWSHHCMIDRIWYLWQLRHGVENIPPSYLERTLAPWDLKVKDVLDTRRLGYEYGSSRILIPALDLRATQAVRS